MFRRKAQNIEVLLVHPGGPFFKKKDAGAWTIPKGEVAEGEELLERAKIEFREELGVPLHGRLHRARIDKAERRQDCSCMGG